MNELTSLVWLLLVLALIVLMFLYAQARLASHKGTMSHKGMISLRQL